ncbi:MBL fold metallo-hydrolase [Flavisolibacter nicotianae]|uniref:MBL fold metallo-hydrolase n=1 Tax=Flavisolibacter nicotianae TaxID=2364882 RepID=UPI000EB22169|nr:MBL fold metallo-hydrolase [Flavisolibacter nicotianae]
MQIKQFEDKNLSQYSYAVVSDCEKKMILIDPARTVQPYLDFAQQNGLQLAGIIETHPHADFVSGHLELHRLTGAPVYTSKRVDATYPHQSFDEGQSIRLGKITLSALFTPGHSPDSICILLAHDGKQKAVFTGDTLFVGDCGRPDLREGASKMHTKREELAGQMFHSLREKLMVLHDDVVVYPAHGAGTLCGKSLGKESSSTIGREKQTNWSLQPASKAEFVENLLADQPFVPQYFPYAVELNRQGVAPLAENLSRIAVLESEGQINGFDKTAWIVDTRKGEAFKNGHLPHSVNLMEDGKFETWLGSIIRPGEKFYLAGENEEQLQRMMKRAGSIGYETAIIAALVVTGGGVKEATMDVARFRRHIDKYTIVDVRNTPEVKAGKIFPGSLAIPLAELRNRVGEIPTDKPIVVHCAGGYRSAAASSLIHSKRNGSVTVLDLGEAVKEFSQSEKLKEQ